MSTNFSSNQFESSFVPQRLQNYEVPHQYKEHPSLRRGYTKIIANDRGHLISSNIRSPTSPWGHFMNTWQIPRKPVQLKIKTKYMTQIESLRHGHISGSESVIPELNGELMENKGSSLAGSRPTSQEDLLENTENKDRKLSPVESETFKQGTPVSKSHSEEGDVSADDKISSDTPQQDQVARTPSQASVQSQSVSGHAPNERSHSGSGQQTRSSSRTHSAPSLSRMSNVSETKSRIQSAAQSTNRKTPSSAAAKSAVGSFYRPHSRQVSREGSGIGTSKGSRVYTPSVSTRVQTTQTPALSVTGSAAGKNNKEVQCPSVSS